MDQLRGFDQVLGGEATAVDAGPADGTLLGHHRRLAQLARGQRGGKSGRARAENHKVESLAHEGGWYCRRRCFTCSAPKTSRARSAKAPTKRFSRARQYCR